MAAPLDIAKTFAGKRLLVFGATGFLGKVWLALLLDRYPEIGHLYLVVRAKRGQNSAARFWGEIATSEVFRPLRERLGEAEFEAFLRARVTPIDGDVTRPLGGVDVSALQEKIHAVVNVAGVVDFSPPLDEALEVNAVGAQRLIALARALGGTAVLHTSTCYVAGNRVGVIKEVSPLAVPFPRAVTERERTHPVGGKGAVDPAREVGIFDPAREIAECTEIIAQTRARAGDAFREAAFVEEARANLEAKGEPTLGAALDDEVRRVRKKFIEKELVRVGAERAAFWGWTNIYTYTKSLGEQLLAASGLPFTIVRPAIIESSLEFPFAGWNEGINTSAPLFYAIVKGLMQLPSGERTLLDVIPVDQVAAGMLLALAALLKRKQEPVYQLGTSDKNGVPLKRLIELSSLYKRKYYKDYPNALAAFVQRRIEAVPVTAREFQVRGAPGLAKAAAGFSSLLKQLAGGPLDALVKPVAEATREYQKLAQKTANVVDVFLPFLTNEYVFSCANVRGLHAGVCEADKERLPWRPEAIDWRHYWLEVHGPALEKWVFPQIEEKQKRPLAPARPHASLTALLDDMAARHGTLPALMRLEGDGFTRVSFAEWRAGSLAVAARLVRAGVAPGDRVVIAAANHPAWPMGYFGVLYAGGVAVPVDPGLETAAFSNLLAASGARVALVDRAVAAKHAGRWGDVQTLDLHAAAAITEAREATTLPPAPGGDALASVIYTSGTTGTPKGVMLTHGNFTALLAALQPVFKLSDDDRVLSVLPLHHTFEFTCGMLLPLSFGARVVYLDELSAERLATGLKKGQITAMIGVPALWQMLERRILSQARERGALGEKYLAWGARLNRLVGDKLGLDLGKVLFAPVHLALGGRMRLLVSGGAALPESTHKLFAGLGLHLAEGYGLTEAAPVLSVQKASPRAKAGSVGQALPGVEIRIADADDKGVGEVQARGPNVMRGYAGDDAATRAALGDDGWLRTGDLGTLDRHGRLRIVGRAKEVIVSASGENVYPEDVENTLGAIAGVREYTVVGVSDGRGGERVGLLAVPEREGDRAACHARARAAISEKIADLPINQRPKVVQTYDADLPRTATRKVKRQAARAILERILAAAEAEPAAGEAAASPVRAIVAALAQKGARAITADTRLADLGFDSLMMVEVVAALEKQTGSRVAGEAVAKAETVGELERLAQARDATPVPAPVLASASSAAVDGWRALAERLRQELTQVRVPDPVREAVKGALGTAQMAFYEHVMTTRVTGRAFIPHNRQTIVVANHTSHLDMGLIKYALGSYGRDLTALAAADYFFDDDLKRAYFENFTNVVALDRKAGMTRTLKEAGAILAQGRTVLIFPEGTRSPDGQIKEFKRLFAHLAITHKVDILPVALCGAFEAMPKGARAPTKREISAHIGPPIGVADLERLFADLPTIDRIRRTAELTQRAVEALYRREVFDLAQVPSADALLAPRAHPLVSLFNELEQKFRKGAVEMPVSFYFTLGEEPEAKWTCKVDPNKCEIVMGKPAGGVADCVLKTSPAIFERIVREAYVPGVEEFLRGAIKSNDVSLLGAFQRAFNLAL